MDFPYPLFFLIYFKNMVLYYETPGKLQKYTHNLKYTPY